MRLFLHLVDQGGEEYLDQQLRPRQSPRNQQEFEALVGYFIDRYRCPKPALVFLEDARSGSILFSTDH